MLVLVLVLLGGGHLGLAVEVLFRLIQNLLVFAQPATSLLTTTAATSITTVLPLLALVVILLLLLLICDAVPSIIFVLVYDALLPVLRLHFRRFDYDPLVLR
jgi:hypothetical protein